RPMRAPTQRPPQPRRARRQAPTLPTKTPRTRAVRAPKRTSSPSSRQYAHLCTILVHSLLQPLECPAALAPRPLLPLLFLAATAPNGSVLLKPSVRTALHCRPRPPPSS